jgi:hypothetical protein
MRRGVDVAIKRSRLIHEGIYRLADKEIVPAPFGVVKRFKFHRRLILSVKRSIVTAVVEIYAHRCRTLYHISVARDGEEIKPWRGGRGGRGGRGA